MASPSRSIAVPRRPSRAESAATQERILDAAEALFVEMGFAATSLRAIAARADVNLAAAHYHFGSKQGLFGATVHRRVAHANEMRLRGLDELEARATPATVEEIIALFFEPLTDESVRSKVLPLIARIYAEPESISMPLLEPYKQELRTGGSLSKQTIVMPHTMTTLRIDSEPSGARVTVDGRELGSTPLEAPVAMGFRRVRIEAGGEWRAFDKVLELTRVEENYTGARRIVLEKDVLTEAELLLAGDQVAEVVALLSGVGRCSGRLGASRWRRCAPDGCPSSAPRHRRCCYRRGTKLRSSRWPAPLRAAPAE